MERLSEHDKAVLDVIFDPLQLMGSNSSTISQEESFSEDDSHSLNFELDTQVAEIVKRAIKASDDGRFDEALEFFEAAIKKAPESPGVLNDRAQVLRLMGRNDEALKDLNLAVSLSKGLGRPGIQALCQRGVLHRVAGHDDLARADFQQAARSGSSFARTQLVALNPYAAMCNSMLRNLNASSASSLT